ncbi:MAG: MBL fold metallo-hydrolase [Syntrophomonadaceae bacterium]|nr:MBL fold metallo-hydrolase [Syntrophomonadaceae bacterium]
MQRITDQVIRLGNRYFNYYLVGEPIAALIEGGVTGGVVSLREQWPGLDHLVKRPEVKYLMAMHGHFDHVCGLPSLKEIFPKAGVLASKEAQKVLTKPKIVADFFYQDVKMTEVLHEKEIIPQLVKSPSVEMISVDQVVGAEDRLDLAKGVQLNILEAPGHSPCSIAAYLPQDQVMFISDATGFQINQVDIFPIFFQSYEQYLETIKRLRSFSTRVIAVAHGRIIQGEEIDFFYDRALDTAITLFNEIQRKLDQGIEEAFLIQELFERYYREDLRIYTPENIMLCVELLVRRVKECI